MQNLAHPEATLLGGFDPNAGLKLEDPTDSFDCDTHILDAVDDSSTVEGQHVLESCDLADNGSGAGVGRRSILDVEVALLSDSNNGDSDGEEENTVSTEASSHWPRKETTLEQNAPVSFSSLSGNSDSEDKADNTASSSTIICHSPEKDTILEQNLPMDSIKIKNISQNGPLDNNSVVKVPLQLPTDNCPDCVDDIQPVDKSEGPTAGLAIVKSEHLKADQQQSLSAELFGDFDDSLSHLSVSDSSSCCSLSSLGSVDDLADLLRSSSGVRDKDMSEEQHRQSVDPSSKIEKEPLIVCGTSTDTVAIMETKAVCNWQDVDTTEGRNHLCVYQFTASTTAVSDSRRTIDSGLSDAVAQEGVATVCEGLSASLPRIEVEAAAADTASGEDSDYEMDVSFSTLFGDDFEAISPLPPSPFNSHVCSLSTPTPLSPLPPSPTKRQLLSPLPQTPLPELNPISPLPQSPINSQRTLLPPISSPAVLLPQSLDKARRDVVSSGSESSGDSHRENEASPVPFDDVAPLDVQIPKPCCLSISVQACSETMVSPCVDGSIDSTPSPRGRKLRLSDTSPFSPLTFVLPSSSEAVSVFDTDPVTPATVHSPALSERPTIFEATSLTKTVESAATSVGDTAIKSEAAASAIFSSSQTKPSSSSKQHLASTAAVTGFAVVPLCETTLASPSADTSPKTASASTVSLSSPLKQSPLMLNEGPPQAFKAAPLTKTAAIPICSAPVTTAAAGIVSETTLSSPSRLAPKSTEVESVSLCEAVPLGKSGTTTVGDDSESINVPFNKNRTRSIDLVDENEKCDELTEPTKETERSVGLGSCVKDGSSGSVAEATGRSPVAAHADQEGVNGGSSELVSEVDEQETSETLTQEKMKPEKSEKTQEVAASIGFVQSEEKVGASDGGAKCTESDLFGDPEKGNNCDDVALSATVLGSQGDAPLSSEHVSHSRSPVEDGEISDSDEEEEGSDKVSAGTIAPLLKEDDKQSAAVSGPELIQLSDISGLQVKRIGQDGENPPHEPVSAPQQLPSLVTKCKNSPKKSGLTQATGIQPIATCKSSTAATFDSLLSSFCSKTVPGRSLRSKIIQQQGSPKKPAPLARLPSTAKSAPKRRKSSQACTPRAADFIGMNLASNPPFADSAETNATLSDTQKPDHTVRSGLKKHNMGRQLSDESQVPVKKRPKVEDASLGDSQHEQKLPSEAQSVDMAMSSDTCRPPPEATPPRCLPGFSYMYELRSRNVTKFQVCPRKRRTSCSEENEQPTRKKKPKLSSLSDLDSEAEKLLKSEDCIANPARTTQNDNSIMDLEEKFVTLMDDSSLTCPAAREDASCPSKSSSHCFPSDKCAEKELICSNGSGDWPPTLEPSRETRAAALPSSDASSSAIVPQPITTSVLAESNHLTSILTDSEKLNGSSDVEDDQSLIIGDLESLLDDNNFPVPSSPPQSPLDSITSNSVRSKPQVRKTDSATGQEEDQTPASSPKTLTDIASKQLFEQKCLPVRGGASNLAVPEPSACTSPPVSQPQLPSKVEAAAKSIAAATCTNSVSVGYGHVQPAPLPKYSPQTPHLSSDGPSKSSISKSNGQLSTSCGHSSSSIIDDDDIFRTPLPLLEKSTAAGLHRGTAHPGGGQTGVSLAQRELTLCMQSPLPLPHWLVAAMARVQSKHEHCAASGMGLSKKKRGNRKCACV